MKKPLMKCGHTANAERSGKPVCLICCGIKDGADKLAEEPDLTNRQARCSYCNKTQQSSINLPFFEHRPDNTEDKYYCGCGGWD